MSKYTTEVRFICEMAAGRTESGDNNDIAQILHSSHASIIGDYPIFDETYRETLNTKILKHYYTREICEETVGLWKLRLNTRMNEIMPFYNQLYKSELLKFNPLYDVNITTTHVRNEDVDGTSKLEANGVRNNASTNETINNREDKAIKNSSEENVSESTVENTKTGNTSTNETNTVSQLDMYSDTPQGGVTGLTSGNYLTNARDVDTTQNNEQTETTASNEKGSGSTKGSSNRIGAEQLNTSEKNTNKQTVNSVSSNEQSNENNVRTTEDYIEQVNGKRGGTSFSKLLSEYRKTFLNIDRMVIDELNDLFFGLWE